MALLYTHSAPEARTCSAAGDFQVYPGRGSHKVYHHDREVDNMTTQTRNEVLLEGIALEAPALSHENHGTRFYRFPLQVPRLSGTPDTLPVLVPEALLTAVRLEDPLRVRGQLRSFNNRSGVGNRLVLTVYAQAMEPGSGEPCNRILLSGALCKPPIFRRTPLGRSICDLMLAVTDTAIAAQNAVVAAQSFGIGSCYIGDIMENCEEQRRILNLPEYVFPAVMLVFGWPTKQQLERTKPQRCDQKHIVHENTYRSMDGNELREMFGYQCKNRSFEDWMNAFCNRKYDSDFAKEMTRSVGEYLKQFENE